MPKKAQNYCEKRQYPSWSPQQHKKVRLFAIQPHSSDQDYQNRYRSTSGKRNRAQGVDRGEAKHLLNLLWSICFEADEIFIWRIRVGLGFRSLSRPIWEPLNRTKSIEVRLITPLSTQALIVKNDGPHVEGFGQVLERVADVLVVKLRLWFRIRT